MNPKFLFAIPALTLLGMAASLPAAPAAPGPDGATLFRQRCGSCHNLTPGARAVLAPSLIGVLNRKAAATAFNYSPALKASNLTWNRANLERYLSGPTKMVPGTRMVISVTDAAQRAAILDFVTRAR